MAFKATYRTHGYKRKGRSVRTRPAPGLHFEKTLRESGAELVAGIDEVGVGAWAGPVVVGAVILEPGRRIYKVRDSKLLDPPRREWLAERVRERSLAWGIGVSWPHEIDSEGLSEAQRRAARRAIEALGITPDACLVDGKWNFIGDGARMIVRGDSESVSIACASLVAKAFRDQLMSDLAPLYSGYSFELNKGYPSPLHKWALAAIGPSSLHRRLFTPVRRLFEEGVPGRLLNAGQAIS
jgi:ribonuclease HII